ncbi:unnamed protein product [Bursaphelenchus xylophilus]|uniref:CXXC-type zinc finger protein 1 n=1 Tax=Bursaphelenchus xylophilus TaxID=6326 RepID=A0A1I7SBQ2_BURXY|nr:unnamed protein product [Bursaphelenchus xylophilus]CAG9111211.1 unnamed protein product [Bursaphelenchus xylophilus]
MNFEFNQHFNLPSTSFLQNLNVTAKGRCGDCIGCLRQSNCEKCLNCIAKRPCFKRICVQSQIIQQTAVKNEFVEKTKPKKVGKKVGRPRKPSGERKPRKRSVTANSQAREKNNRDTQQQKVTVISKEEEKVPRHCYGPQCESAARPGSKYCSDECGQNLARKRLALLLPQRIQDYYEQTPMWKVETEEKIQKLRNTQLEIEETLKRIDDCAQNLNLYFTTLASGQPIYHRPAQQDEDSTFVHSCMVCGMEVPVKALPKHVQRCFVRIEKQSSFGTSHKFGINPHNIMCEKFDKNTKTFCKRLRVICSEHYRDEIGSSFKICGYPLAWTRVRSLPLEEMFLKMDILEDGMCMNERKTCETHYMWEQAASAVIENQRLQHLLRIDEIQDQYRRLAESHAVQRNAITVLMNSRTTHGQIPEDIQQKLGPPRSVRVFKDDDIEMVNVEDDGINSQMNELQVG